jgi:hypothetical protein
MSFSARNNRILRRIRAANVPIFELVALQWAPNYVDCGRDAFPFKQGVRWQSLLQLHITKAANPAVRLAGHFRQQCSGYLPPNRNPPGTPFPQ